MESARFGPLFFLFIIIIPENNMSDAKEKMLEGLKKVVRNEIQVYAEPLSAPLSVCDSRMGGRPAVPPDFVWPEASYKRVVSSLLGPLSFLFREKSRHEVVTTKPLAFLAQFNLKDVAPLDKENLLPQTGVLSFFYDLQEVPEHEGSARVFYFLNTRLTSRNTSAFRTGKISSTTGKTTKMTTMAKMTTITKYTKSVAGNWITKKTIILRESCWESCWATRISFRGR